MLRIISKKAVLPIQCSESFDYSIFSKIWRFEFSSISTAYYMNHVSEFQLDAILRNSMERNQSC